jgi:hypothetical protein
MGDTWRLYAGDELLADLNVTGGDFPWLHARVEPKDGFERYRDLFANARYVSRFEPQRVGGAGIDELWVRPRSSTSSTAHRGPDRARRDIPLNARRPHEWAIQDSNLGPLPYQR